MTAANFLGRATDELVSLLLFTAGDYFRNWITRSVDVEPAVTSIPGRTVNRRNGLVARYN